MNFLVFVETDAGELEKVLSGLKTMLVKGNCPEGLEEPIMQPGDSLFFLRDNEECIARVKAVVVQVLPREAGPAEDISPMLKELQPKLQLTEDQYNSWSVEKRALFIEFEAAQKIEELQVAPEGITQRTRWMQLEGIHQAAQEGRQDASGNDLSV